MAGKIRTEAVKDLITRFRKKKTEVFARKERVLTPEQEARAAKREKLHRFFRGRFMSGALTVAFFAGLFAVSYPALSNYVNSRAQSGAISSYNSAMQQLTEADVSELWEEAENYNYKRVRSGMGYNLTEEALEEYYATFDPAGTGVMGEVEIPLIGVHLPVYHGVDDTVLQVAVGHIPGSSIPVGGVSTHSVLSGHRGLPSSRLFTDLDRLAEGDTFLLNVMNKTLAYEIDQIKIVNPNELDLLRVETGSDLCTLVTCTPYGINSHRLLIRGRRVDYEKERTLSIAADGIQVDPINIAPVMSLSILLVLFIYQMFFTGTSKKRIEKAGAEKMTQRMAKEALRKELLHLS